MEITMDNFWRKLPRILISIAESNFIAIDVEMTGISDRLSDIVWKQNNHTRQGLYEAGKRIASKYNVFQLGLTCVKPDGEGSYKTETYSFYVSPLLLEDTREDDFFAQDVGRNLTTSLSTLKFLRKEGLRLEKIFDNPVPYLSRKEVREAEERLGRRTQKPPVKDHRYNEDDEGLSFFSTYVFDEITTWLSDRSEDKDPEIRICIPPSESRKRSSVYHNIVRVTAQNLVPDMRCRTWNYGAVVLISGQASDEDNERQRALQDRFTASVSKQTGIRLILEALVGGPFADIVDPNYVMEALTSWPGDMTAKEFCQEVEQKFGDAASIPSELQPDNHEGGDKWMSNASSDSASSPRASDGASDFMWSEPEPQSRSWEEHGDFDERTHDEDEQSEGTLREQIRSALCTLEHRLSCMRPAIVGHNQFWDLLFLYQTFFEDLPDSAGEFFANIHEMFPHVLDTKLMAISHQPIEGEDPLADLFSRFTRSDAKPHIYWDVSTGYNRMTKAHEAGNDSFMTATILLRLAHKLASESCADDETWNEKMQRLYSRGWLIEVGRDPDCFGSGWESDFGGRASYSDDDDDDVGSLHWGHQVFEPFRNTLRIGPFTTVFLERQCAADRTFRRCLPHVETETE